MKVIDLLNKIANEEDVPHKIKYNGYTYKKCVDNQTYWTGDKPSNTLRIDTYDLNDEVEIIEGIEITEEDKEIEELNLDTDKLRGIETPRAIDYLLESKINELVRELNELKKGK